MPVEKMWVEWDDGSNLGRSKDGDTYAANAYADGKLVDQARLKPIDEEEEYSFEHNSWRDGRKDEPRPMSQEEIEALATMIYIVVGLAAAAVAAAPHVHRWCKTSFAPSVRNGWNATKAHLARPFKKHTKTTPAESAEVSVPIAIPIVIEQAEPSDAVEASPTQDRVTMTSEVARQRILSALLAAAYSDEQLRMVANAQIVDGNQRALEMAVQSLTPAQASDVVNKMLEADPTLASNEEVADYVTVLEDGGLVDEKYLLPIPDRRGRHRA